MSIVVMGSGGGLNNTKLKLADADATDVLKGKKFYSGNKDLKTGTLELTGNAGAGDVLKGSTFYNTNAKSKITGTLELTGNAGAGDVLKGSTFYNTNAKSKITGTLELTGDASAEEVLSGYTFYNTDAKTKVTGTLSLSGNAGAGNVLSGYTFYNTDAKTKVTGTMPNNGSLDRTYSGTNITLGAGYYSGGTFSVNGGNRGAWGTTLNPGGSVTVPAGYHNGSGTVSVNSVSSVLKSGSYTDNAQGGHYIHVVSGTLVGITNISLPSAAYQTVNPGVSVWLDGNTIHVQLGRVDGFVTIAVSYIYY